MWKITFLLLEREYVVLAIEIQNGERSFISYRIIPNEGCAILVPANIFCIISHKLSSNWILSKTSDSFYSLESFVWSRDGFWEDYYNDDPEAIKDFEKEKEKIFAEENTE